MTITPPDPPSEFRGRVLEVLELIADRDAQLGYQAAAPHVDVATELFNQWDDAYHDGDAAFERQFSPAELAALRRFGGVLDDVAARTPQQLPPLAVFVTTSEWRELTAGARTALSQLDVTRRDGLAEPPVTGRA
jgi:hypothetical protein